MSRITYVFLMVMLVAAMTPFGVAAANDDLQLDVKSFQLQNGMLFLVVERPTTPQVACRLAIRAGSALEETGQTGIAHMLEHMMFKGTKNFGTLDWKKDQRLQAEIESAYQTVLAEQRQRHPDPQRIEAALAQMAELRQQVQEIYVPQAFSSQLGKNGAVGINAFTTKDQTQYMASVPSDMVEQWFSIISEQIFEPSWREFYVEKSVVQREWAFRYVNNPNGAAWLDLHATAYTAHPYRNPTIGWKSDMETYSTRDAAAFHQRHYNPTNAVCVLVGDITLEKARQLAGIYFARYPAGQRSPERVTAEPRQQGPRKHVRYLKGARTPLVRIGFHAAPMGSDDFYALDAMTMILSQGRSARMTQNIVDKGLAVDAWAYNPDNRYGTLLIAGGSPNEPDSNGGSEAYLEACRELERLLMAELETLKTTPVSTRELDRIKKMNRRDFLDRMRSNESLAQTLATIEVQVGWPYLNTYLDKMASVSPADILRVARKYVDSSRRNTVFVIPGGQPDQPPQNYTEMRSVGASAAIQFNPRHALVNHSVYKTPEGWRHPLSFERQPKKITYPDPQTHSLNGATVFFLPDRELPLIDLTLLLPAGEVDVPDAQYGLGKLLSDTLVRGGTLRLNPAELALALDENAIRLTLDVKEEHSVVNLSVMQNDWKKGIDMLAEVLTQPAFEDRVLEVARQQALVALRRQGGDAQTVAAREAQIWRFKGHVYGRDPLMGLKTIPTLKRTDLIDYLQTHFVPGNMVAAVSGDLSVDEALDGLGRLFQKLPQKSAPKRHLTDPSSTPPALVLIHKPGQVQSQVILDLPGPRRSNEDYWKLRLLMDIFGGNDSRMYTRLRDDLGLVYSAGFYQTFKWQAGMLIGYIGCKGDQTRKAIAETADIMTSLQHRVPGTDYEVKRLDALNSFVFNVDTPADLVTVYGHYRMRGEPLNTLERIQEAYLTADRQELAALARRYLKPEKLQIVVVADKTIPVTSASGKTVTLESDLRQLADQMGLAFHEMPLR